ncbi:hypothetical protein Tco_0773583 [Tanacetum coccineum]|uniref:MAK10-like protein n=1 Tax=Tanacetum coccineum TaxID=301880 RepID=A0ABQ4ZM70_9ASTR
MGDENPIHTLGYYSKPSHEGYRKTTICASRREQCGDLRSTPSVVQNRCSFHGLWSEDPNQHLKNFLKLVDSLDLDVDPSPHGRILLLVSLLNSFHPEKDCKTPSINAITICLKQPNKSGDDKLEDEGREEEGNPENINTTPPSPLDPSITFIIEKVRKLNSFLESSDLVPRSSDEKFKYLRTEGSTIIEGLEVEYFDIFLTRNEVAYHKYLMCGPIPSIFLRNPVITEGCPSNLKIPSNIGHVHVEKAYIDLNSPLNVMPRMLYNWIMRRKLDTREDPNRGINNFTRRIKGMHVFVGNFTYVIDFMIAEDISSIVDPRLSQVVLRKPFVEISNMTHDLSLGVVKFTDGVNEITYKMPHKIEQYDSLFRKRAYEIGLP